MSDTEPGGLQVHPYPESSQLSKAGVFLILTCKVRLKKQTNKQTWDAEMISDLLGRGRVFIWIKV